MKKKNTAPPLAVLCATLLGGSACGSQSSPLPDGDVVDGALVDGDTPSGDRQRTPADSGAGYAEPGDAAGGGMEGGRAEGSGGEQQATSGGASGDAGGGGDADAGEGDAGELLADASDAGGDEVAGDEVVLHETIVVSSGETYDGHGTRYVAGQELGDGSQSEDQEPLFRLESGARLVDVVLAAPAADGIHCYGDATLQDIVWEDIGEDALTIKESGTVILDGGSARAGEDKVFQINAASTFVVSNFTATDAGKFIRQNGGTTFKVDVVIDRCDISRMDEAIFRTDSSISTVTMINSRYSMIGEALYIGVAPENITEAGNTEY